MNHIGSPDLTLAGPAELAARFKVSRYTIRLWRDRQDFPAPLAELAAGPVWDLTQVEKWRKADPKARKPYRTRPR